MVKLIPVIVKILFAPFVKVGIGVGLENEVAGFGYVPDAEGVALGTNPLGETEGAGVTVTAGVGAIQDPTLQPVIELPGEGVGEEARYAHPADAGLQSRRLTGRTAGGLRGRRDRRAGARAGVDQSRLRRTASAGGERTAADDGGNRRPGREGSGGAARGRGCGSRHTAGGPGRWHRRYPGSTRGVGAEGVRRRRGSCPDG